MKYHQYLISQAWFYTNAYLNINFLQLRISAIFDSPNTFLCVTVLVTAIKGSYTYMHSMYASCLFHHCEDDILAVLIIGIE